MTTYGDGVPPQPTPERGGAMSNTDDELDKMEMKEYYAIVFHELDNVKLDILLNHLEEKYLAGRGDIESQVREAYDLLFWKYKELNGQTVDMKFVEAYNILTEELQAPKNGDSDE